MRRISKKGPSAEDHAKIGENPAGIGLLRDLWQRQAERQAKPRPRFAKDVLQGKPMNPQRTSRQRCAEQLLAKQKGSPDASSVDGAKRCSSGAAVERAKRSALQEVVRLELPPTAPHRVGAEDMTIADQTAKLKESRAIQQHSFVRDAWVGCKRSFAYFHSGRMNPKMLQERAKKARKLLENSSNVDEQVLLLRAESLPVNLGAAGLALAATGKKRIQDFGLSHVINLCASSVASILQCYSLSTMKSGARSDAERWRHASEMLTASLRWHDAAKVSNALCRKYRGMKPESGDRDVLANCTVVRQSCKVVCGSLSEDACEREVVSSLLIQSRDLTFGNLLSSCRSRASREWQQLDEQTVRKLACFTGVSDLAQCLQAKAKDVPSGKEVSNAYVKKMSDDPFSDLGGSQVYCLGCKRYVPSNTYERRRHNIRCVGNEQGHLRTFIDARGRRMGMHMHYQHNVAKNTVSFTLKAPVPAVVRHALWASYWPADRVRAAWRLVGVPRPDLPAVKTQDPSPPAGTTSRGGAAQSSTARDGKRQTFATRSARRGRLGVSSLNRSRLALTRRGASAMAKGSRRGAKGVAAPKPTEPPCDDSESGEQTVAAGVGSVDSSGAKAVQFTMMDSLDVPQPPQPLRLRLPLKSEQLHTLGWMHQREGRHYPGASSTNAPRVFSSTELLQRRFGSTGLVLQVRIERDYMNVRGGVLGDVVGYGKTACMIALIAEAAQEDVYESIYPGEEELRAKLILTSATLIVTPPNLFGQWRDEFKKFLGDDNDLKLVEIVDFNKLKRLTVQDIVSADVVLISFRFFFSEAYQRTVDGCVNPGLKVESPAYKKNVKARSLAKAKAKAEQEAATVVSKASKSRGRPQQTKPRLSHPFGGASALPGYGHHPFSQQFGSFSNFHRPMPMERFTKHYKELKQRPHYLAERFVKTRRLTEQQLRHLTPEKLKNERTILEQFYWHRVVFDEFHEVLKIRKGLPHYALRQLHSRYIWGLTATPPLDSAQGISDMASLLHVYVQPTEEACKPFLDEWVRSNSWDVASVPMQEHWHSVDHTRPERALYLNQKHMLEQHQRSGNDTAFKQEQRLLMFCTHFSPEEPDQADDAKVAVKNTQRQQRESLASTMQRLRYLEVEHARLISKQEAFESLCGLCSETQHVVLAAHLPIEDLQVLAAELQKTGMDSAGHARRDELIAAILGSHGALAHVWAEHCDRGIKPGMCHLCDQVATLEAAIAEKNRQIGRLRSRQQDSEASIRFFESTLRAFSEDKAEQLPECTVCLVDIERSELAITRCGHVFHEACIHQTVKVQKACPQCRQPLSMGCVTLVKNATAAITEAPAMGSEDPETQRFGSKLSAVLRCVREIRGAEPEAKVIIFLQWEPLASQVELSLTTANLSPLRLRGATRDREKIIGSFTKHAGFQCLVLSLEQSPSGMNLTAANHVLLVHPMYAASHAAAVACEQQAIGRIRRQGQTKMCHVHRFFTRDTIEEDLVKKNHSEGFKKNVRKKANTTQRSSCSSSSGA